MSGKRNSRAGEKPADKYDEQTMFAVEKMTVLHMSSKEIGITAVGRHYGVTESMTRRMTKSNDKVGGGGGGARGRVPGGGKNFF